MEIHQLRYVCAVARAGSFVRAAEEEGVTQPSLSQAIHKLETEVGVPLFDRLGRSVKLTRFGQELVTRAEGILRQMAEAQRAIQDLNSDSHGKLVVGAIPTILPYFLAPRIGAFLAGLPGVEMELREEQTQRLIQLLQSGEVDVAVLALPVASQDLVCSELFREPLLAAIPATHRLAQEPRVELRAMLHERMLLLKEGHCLRDDVLTICSRAKTEFHKVFESDNLTSIFAMVAGGFGLSIIPQMAAAVQSGCVIVPLERPAVRRVGYAQARGHYSSPLQQRFIRWLKTQRPSQ